MLYSRKDAAQALSLGIRTLDQLIATGKIVALRVGRRVLVSRESLESFANTEVTIEPGAEPSGSEIRSRDTARNSR